MQTAFDLLFKSFVLLKDNDALYPFYICVLLFLSGVAIHWIISKIKQLYHKLKQF
jgi:hypothetical protein